MSSSKEEEEDGAINKRKTKRRKRGSKFDSKHNKDGVLYIGHLGNDFQEAELAKFLSQFGKLLRLRLSRSKRTGNPRGYAFCQFASSEVADIVADTLQGYILFGTRRLVCHKVPPTKVHDRLFFKFVFTPPPPPKQTKARDTLTAVTQKLVQRERRKRKALQDMGIDYDFPGYEAALKESKGYTPEKPAVDDDNNKEHSRKKARKVSNADDSTNDDIETKVEEGGGLSRKDSAHDSKQKKKDIVKKSSGTKAKKSLTEIGNVDEETSTKKHQKDEKGESTHTTKDADNPETPAKSDSKEGKKIEEPASTTKKVKKKKKKDKRSKTRQSI